jgi:hypothetical protein
VNAQLTGDVRRQVSASLLRSAAPNARPLPRPRAKRRPSPRARRWPRRTSPEDVTSPHPAVVGRGYYAAATSHSGDLSVCWSRDPYFPHAKTPPLRSARARHTTTASQMTRDHPHNRDESTSAHRCGTSGFVGDGRPRLSGRNDARCNGCRGIRRTRAPRCHQADPGTLAGRSFRAASGAAFCRQSPRGGGPIEKLRNGALDEVFSGAETKCKSVGVQRGLSTTVWGFKSAKRSMVVNIRRSKT